MGMLVRSLVVSLLGALLAVPVVCQINAVPGMDVQLYEVAGIGYYGHRGAAYPNGEAGFMVGHSHANCGVVNVPWVSTIAGGVMVDTYPKIAFLLARESTGRMALPWAFVSVAVSLVSRSKRAICQSGNCAL